MLRTEAHFYLGSIVVAQDACCRIFIAFVHFWNIFSLFCALSFESVRPLHFLDPFPHNHATFDDPSTGRT